MPLVSRSLSPVRPLALVGLSAIVLLTPGCGGGGESAKPTSGSGGGGSASVSAGRIVFQQNCTACHGIHGKGVPGSFPALQGSPIVAGDPEVVVRVVLLGAKGALGDRGAVAVMPPFRHLQDQQVASLVTFLRHQYADGAAGVDAATVARVRAALPP